MVLAGVDGERLSGGAEGVERGGVEEVEPVWRWFQSRLRRGVILDGNEVSRRGKEGGLR